MSRKRRIVEDEDDFLSNVERESYLKQRTADRARERYLLEERERVIKYNTPDLLPEWQKGILPAFLEVVPRVPRLVEQYPYLKQTGQDARRYFLADLQSAFRVEKLDTIRKPITWFEWEERVGKILKLRRDKGPLAYGDSTHVDFRMEDPRNQMKYEVKHISMNPVTGMPYCNYGRREFYERYIHIHSSIAQWKALGQHGFYIVAYPVVSGTVYNKRTKQRDEVLEIRCLKFKRDSVVRRLYDHGLMFSRITGKFTPYRHQVVQEKPSSVLY